MTTSKRRTNNHRPAPIAGVWAVVVLVSLLALTLTALAITRDVPQTVLLLTGFDRTITLLFRGSKSAVGDPLQRS